MRFLLIILLFVLVSCDSGENNTKTAEEVEAEILAIQQRIAAERKAQQAQLVEQRGYVSARFMSVSQDFLEVELFNKTGKDIDNIVGSLEVLDNNGNRITSIALTNWVPGDIYLLNGSSVPARKALKLEKPETREQIILKAAEYEYHYTVLRIQFVGEDEVSYLAPITEPEPVVITETKPINQASPEPCANNQVTLETEEIYYPGPKCEHIGRSLDSERFKVEYINLCKSKLGISGNLPSVARVQVSSCIYETNRSGLTYRKRICCDTP